MNNQQAIEFIGEIKHSGNSFGNAYISDFNKCKGIVELLKRGKKYEEMWNDFIYGLAYVNIGSYRNPCDERKMTDIDYINEIVRNVKQAHFPYNKTIGKYINEPLVTNGVDDTKVG